MDTWRIGDADTFLPPGFTAVAGWPEPFPAAPKNMDEVPVAAYDASARLEYMDRVGIWAMALYPNVGGFGSQAFLNLKDPELMLACVRAYNDFLIDWISPDPRRFIPILATPFWDVGASVAEIERCAKLGHKGILFTGGAWRRDTGGAAQGPLRERGEALRRGDTRCRAASACRLTEPVVSTQRRTFRITTESISSMAPRRPSGA